MKQKLIENVSQITCGLTFLINPWPVCSLVFSNCFPQENLMSVITLIVCLYFTFLFCIASK